MADNVNPQAIKFANEKARVFAEALLSAIESAKVFEAFYAAQSLDTVFPATADNLADGSEVDGRPRVTNNAIRALRTAATDMITWAGQGSPTREARLRNMTHKGESRI